MKILKLLFLVLLGLTIFGITTSAQIASGQVDDFEDGTVQGWIEGGASPNAPTNIADGGPNGTGDNYLQNISSGGGGAGSRQIMFNISRWSGDYTSAGVTNISMYMNNLGATNLEMRLTVAGNGGRFSSTDAVSLTAGSGWQIVVFPVGPSDLTPVDGGTDVNATLASVTELRILHNTAPAWKGLPIAATLGVDNITAADAPVSVVETDLNVPSEFQLEQNYPNPFNPSTKISFSIPESGNVSLKVFDLIGREVASLINEEMQPGNYSINFNASNLSSGLYFYKIKSSQFSESKKMMLLK